MADDVAKRRGDALDEEAIAKAHAIYTPSMLSIYDLLVHGASNHLAWRCPTRKLFEPYRANLSANHLEAGVGTGYFLDRAGRSNVSSSSTSIEIALRVPSGGWRASNQSFVRRIC
jgi:hypothetical protein